MIRPLADDAAAVASAVELLLANCPNESERYEEQRLFSELVSNHALPFYRRFFAAYDHAGVLIGVGGVKAADWASDTHILYMMAVDSEHRGKGVGSDLERVRIQWLRDNFTHGRCLVSSKHKKRFERWGFTAMSEIDDRYLLMLEF